jgi:hypothetical protein
VLEFENTIPIDRPIDEVFAFLSDFENIPKWNYYVLEVRQLSESPIGIGTTYHQERKTRAQDRPTGFSDLRVRAEQYSSSEDLASVLS